MTDEVRRRGRNLPDNLSAVGRSAKSTPAKTARVKTGRAGKGRHGDPGTGTVDPRRIRGRPQARGDREGGQGLAVDPPACYHRRATPPPQEGAIDGRGIQADRHAQEFERARFRREDRRRYPLLPANRRIEALLGVEPVSLTAASALQQNKQKRKLWATTNDCTTQYWRAQRPDRLLLEVLVLGHFGTYGFSCAI